MKLTERECQDMREMAKSEQVRKDFERLRELTREASARASFADVLSWLSSMSRIFGPPRRPRQPFIETNMKL